MNKLVVKGVSLCLAASMVLSGCSKVSKTRSSDIKLENGEITEKSYVMSVGNQGVRYDEVRNYCYFLKNQYNKNFGEKIWDYAIDENKTLGDEAKEEVINMITEMKIITKTAKSKDVELTADEKDEAVSQAEELVANATAEDKKNYFLTVQGLTDVFEENLLANKMFYIATDAADTNVTDEEAKQIQIQYFMVMTKGTSRNGVKINMSDEEKEEALKSAKEMKKAGKNAEDFLAYAEENSDLDEVELVIGKDSEKLDRAVITEAFTLKKGEVSQVIEAEDGYYVVYCVNDYDEDATYARKEEIIEERQTAMFKKKYTNWMKKSSVSISETFWNQLEI